MCQNTNSCSWLMCPIGRVQLLCWVNFHNGGVGGGWPYENKKLSKFEPTEGCSRGIKLPSPPPLRKHGQGQKNNGHTGSQCLDKPVLACDAQHKETLHTENLPIPHTKHITHKHGTRTQRVGKIQHGPRVLTAHQQVWNRNPFQPCASSEIVAHVSPSGQALKQAWLQVWK